MLADKTPVNEKAAAPDKAQDASHAASTKGLDEVHQTQAQSTKAGGDTQAIKPGGDSQPVKTAGDTSSPAPSADSTPTRLADKDRDTLATSSDLRAVAAAVREATGNDNYVARWADSDRIVDLLKNRSEVDKKAIDAIYKEQYKVSVSDDMHAFMGGTARAKFDAAWTKKDNDGPGSASDRINISLVESQQTTGRSQAIVEQDLKDTLRTKSPTQIKALEDDYQSKHGQSLKDAIAANDTLSPSTRDALNVYLNKTDSSPDADFDKLTKSALGNKDLNLFAETMSVATPEQRQRFAKEGGDDKLSQSFSGYALAQAKDYGKDGRLSVEQQVSSNTGYLWDNNQGIELGLARMTDGQRSDFAIGKSLSQDDKGIGLNQSDKTRLAGLTDDQKANARQYYEKVHSTLTAAGNETEVARWESMTGSRGGGLAARMDQHRGWLYNSSTETIRKSVQDMSEEDWTKARQNPDRERADLRQALTSLGRSPNDVKSIIETFDKRIADTQYKPAADQPNETTPDQPGENPADSIHTAIAGFGGGQKIVDTIKSVPPEKLGDLRRDYATKYGTSLDNALMDKLSNQQMAEVQRHMVSGQSLDTRVDQARDEAYRTRDGIGSALTDTVSATGGQADDTLRDVLAAQTEANKSNQPVDRAQIQTVFENYAKAIDNNREAKAAAGDYAADGLIAGAAIAATVASGGTGLPLIAATLAAGGAATKVGAKSLMMGRDYDWNVSSVSTDAAGGAIMGATSVFGPGQVAAVFKLGGNAAEAASSTVFSNFAEKGLLAPGAADTLRAGTASAMHEVLASGSTKIEGRAFASVADRAVSPSLTGQARTEAIKGLQDSLAAESTKQYANQTSNWLANQARSQGLNTLAGTAGGASSGFVEGVAQWDSTQSLTTNLNSLAMHSTISGLSAGAGAFAFGGIAKAAAHGYNSFRATPEQPTFGPLGHEKPTIQLPAATEQSSSPVVFRRAANDNSPVSPTTDVKEKPQQLTAANDNYMAVQSEQKLVANGYNGPGSVDRPQTIMSGSGETPSRPMDRTTTAVNTDSAANGNLNREGTATGDKAHRKTLGLPKKDAGVETETPVEAEPPVATYSEPPDTNEFKPRQLDQDGLKNLQQYVDHQSQLREGAGRLLPPEQEAARAQELKDSLAFLESKVGNETFNSSAFADLIKLKFSEKPPNIEIPLDRLRHATPEALELSAKLLRQANDVPKENPLLHYETTWKSDAQANRDNQSWPRERVARFDVGNTADGKGAIYKRTDNEMYGDQYEVAANNFLRKYFNSPETHQPWLVERSSGSNRAVDPADYIYIPGGKGSPSDHSKFDGVFINLRSGQIKPIDLKSSEGTAKRSEADGDADFFKLFIGASGVKPKSGTSIDADGVLSNYSKASRDNIVNANNEFVVPPSDEALAANLGQRLSNNSGIKITKDMLENFPSVKKLGTDGETLAAVKDFANSLAPKDDKISMLAAYRDELTNAQYGIKKGMVSDRNNSAYHIREEARKEAAQAADKIAADEAKQAANQAKMLTQLHDRYAKAGIGEDLFDDARKMRTNQTAFGLPGELSSINDLLNQADRVPGEAPVYFDKKYFFDQAKTFWQSQAQPAESSKVTDLFGNRAQPEDRGAVEAVIARELLARNSKLSSEAATEKAKPIYDKLLDAAKKHGG